MAEVVSDSEPSPLEALRTGLNIAAALAVSDATSGTGITPGKQGDMQLVYNYYTHLHANSLGEGLSHPQYPKLRTQAHKQPNTVSEGSGHKGHTQNIMSLINLRTCITLQIHSISFYCNFNTTQSIVSKFMEVF